jgi:hypothetical protein
VARPLISLVFFLLGSLALGAAHAAGGSFPMARAVKVASIEADDVLNLPLAEDSLNGEGDAVMLFLRTEYANASLFIPVGYGSVEQVEEGVCRVRILERTDDLSTANWGVPDQSGLAERKQLYGQYAAQAEERIRAGSAGEARALLDEALDKGVPERALRGLFQRIDISRVTTPDGQTFEQVVPDGALRKVLAQPEYLDVTIAILNKEDWVSPKEREWVLRSLPGRSPQELAELLLVL